MNVPQQTIQCFYGDRIGTLKFSTENKAWTEKGKTGIETLGKVALALKKIALKK